MAELAGQDELVEDTAGSHPAWLYAVVGTLGLVMVLTALICKCKSRYLRGLPDGGVAEGIPGLRRRPRDCGWCR